MLVSTIRYESDPTLLNDSTRRMHAGGYYYHEHATYGMWLLRYVQLKDAVTYAAGQVLTKANILGTAATNDISGGSSIGKSFAGISLRVGTTAYWNLILVGGYYPAIITNGDDDIADGVQLIVGAADGVCDSGTALQSFGYAVGADVDAANTVAGVVTLAT